MPFILNQYVMGLFDKIRAAGVRTYESKPLWEPQGEVLAIVNTASNGVDLVDGDYGWALRVREGSQSAYLQVEGYRDAEPPQGRYIVRTYVATRDYTEGDVYEGDTSVRCEPEDAPGTEAAVELPSELF